MEKLIENNANVNIEDDMERTLLEIAKKSGNY